MAILKTVVLDSGVIIENGYHKVVRAEALAGGMLIYTVLSYKDSAKELPSFNCKTYKSSYDLEGDNIFVQAYADMKVNDFSNGTDV